MIFTFDLHQVTPFSTNKPIERVYFFTWNYFISVGVIKCDAKDMGSHLLESVCTTVARRHDFEGQHEVSHIRILGSWNFKNVQMLIADFSTLNLVSCILVKINILSFKVFQFYRINLRQILKYMLSFLEITDGQFLKLAFEFLKSLWFLVSWLIFIHYLIYI